MGRGRGWHGEPMRHSLAARRGIQTEVSLHAPPGTNVWDLPWFTNVYGHMSRLLVFIYNETWSADIASRYSREVEYILVSLERNLSPQMLSVTTRTSRTVETELQLARDSYENSLEQMKPVNKVVLLEQSREYLHGIIGVLIAESKSGWGGVYY